MRRLLLLRHAKAVRDHEAESDEARGLTAEGEQDAAAAALALRKAAIEPGVILVSPAERTRRTAIPVLAAFPHARAALEPNLYLAEAEEIWSIAKGAAEACVLVIGHNPGVHDLACELLRQSGDRSPLARDIGAQFPTAAWAAFSLAGEVLEAAGPRLLEAWRPARR